MKKIFTLFVMLVAATSIFAQDEPLWTATGAYSYYPEDWGWDNSENLFVGNKGVKAESYDGYTIIRAWCGVEGVDLAFGHEETEGEYIAPTSICTINNGEWSDEKIVSVDKYDYYVVETGMEQYPYARISKAYSYLTISLAAEATEEEEATDFYADIILNMDLGTDADFTTAKPAQIYIVFPEDQAVTRLAEDDAVLIYKGEGEAAFGSKKTIEEKVAVEVYDMFVLAKAFAGVEDYDIKVFYTTDEEGKTTISKISPANTYTGLSDFDMCYFYPSDSSVKIEEEGGVLKLYGYWNSAYTAYGTYTLTWTKTIDNSVEAINLPIVNHSSYNLAGQKVSDSYKGIIIKGGKKFLVK